jgi:hypothetical protein
MAADLYCPRCEVWTVKKAPPGGRCTRAGCEWEGKLADAKSTLDRLGEANAKLSKVREVINGLANECPTHHMTGVDPMCSSCDAKNEENPYWPALTAIIEAMRPTE